MVLPDNEDPRKAVAHGIYEEWREWEIVYKNTSIGSSLFRISTIRDSRPLLIHKTTRAGATTSLLVESLDREERFICLVPTNWIATKTIVRDVKRFTERPDPEIVHVPANRNCMLNLEMMKEYPDLKELPVLPLADNCDKCGHYDECRVTAVLRHPEADGFVLTYSKLVALVLAAMSRPNSKAERILEVIKTPKNLLLDEVHEFQFGNLRSLTVHDNVCGDTKLEKYAGVTADPAYPCLTRIITAFALVLSDDTIREAVFEVHTEIEDPEYSKHHIRKIIENPSPETVDREDRESEVKLIVGTFNEIIELTKNREQYHLSMEDILDLYKILSIILNPKLAINGLREFGIVKVQLSDVNLAFNKLLASFVKSIEQEKKRVMLTSATIGDFDYGFLFKDGIEPKKVMFGENGDPLNTNSKMLILADTKKYHAWGDYSLERRRKEIVLKIRDIFEAYGKENCLIVTLNKKEAEKLESALEEIGSSNKVEYYKSPDLMGVSASQRVMIAVGLARKPVNAYDVLTDSLEESRVMNTEAVDFDTWQAWSRVKDPEGKERSLVFALGCTEEECENLSTYGFDRRVEIEPYERNQKKHVKVSIGEQEISKPEVKKTRNFEEMLREAFFFKLPKNCEYFPPNFLCNNINRTFSAFYSQTLDSPADLLERIINRKDCYGVQRQDKKGKWIFQKISFPVTDSLIAQHLKGEVTIGTYQVGLDSTAKVICLDIDAHTKGTETEEQKQAIYDKAERGRERLFNFLNSINVPSLLENSGSPHGYHIWIFIQPVEAAKAKYFGEQLRKEAGFEKDDIEVYPKQGKLWSRSDYGNLVKLPLAFHNKHNAWSKILVNGEWVTDFKNLEIKVIDISDIELPERQEKSTKMSIITVTPTEPSIPCCSSSSPSSSFLPVQTEIRPCITAALQQQLTGDAGNFMRVASVREHFNAGISEPEILASMFSTQKDFSYEKSLYHVRRILEKPGIHISCSTLREKGNSFINCSECRYRHSYLRKIEVSKNPPSSDSQQLG